MPRRGPGPPRPEPLARRPPQYACGVATFEYTALSAAGARVQGVLAGPSEQAVLAELEQRQLTPVAIEEKAESARSRRRPSLRRLGDAYQSLGALLHAGVPLLRGLKLLGGGKGDKRLAGLFRELGESVEKGSDLAAAMAERPEAFPPVHAAMVRAGEKGGFLEDVLTRLGALVLAQADLRSRIVGSLVYPCVLIVVFIGVFGVLFGVFVPKFRQMFAEMNSELPLLTRVVFGVSDAVGKYGLLTAGAIVAGAWGIRVLSRRERVRTRIAEWSLRPPVIGPLLRSLATVRFCQLLGTMLANGVPMMAALSVAKDGTGHPLYARAVEEASESVRAGEQLAVPLGRSGLFDADVVEMISVGEAANNLDQVLLRVAEGTQARLDRHLTVAVRLIEPLMILGLGAVVGVAAAGLLLPMTNLGSGL